MVSIKIVSTVSRISITSSRCLEIKQNQNRSSRKCPFPGTTWQERKGLNLLQVSVLISKQTGGGGKKKEEGEGERDSPDIKNAHSGIMENYQQFPLINSATRIDSNIHTFNLKHLQTFDAYTYSFIRNEEFGSEQNVS